MADQLKPIYLLQDNARETHEEDHLGMKAWVDVIAGTAVGNDGPFTIGIYKEWGYGKTTLLQLAKETVANYAEKESEPVPERLGDCPWPDCPEPATAKWTFVAFGFPETAHLEYNAETGLCRVRDGPRPKSNESGCYSGCGRLPVGGASCPDCRGIICPTCHGCFCSEPGLSNNLLVG